MQTKFMTWISLGLAALPTLAACNSVVADSRTEALPSKNQETTLVETEITSDEKSVAEENAANVRVTKPAPTEEPGDTGRSAQATITVDPSSAVPVLLGGTDLSQYNVPLEEIHFDTFNGSSIPLSKITESRLLQLRDAIPPIEAPQYTNVATADEWLNPNDIVIGYVDGDEALAYPIRILNYHEIINETVNDVPILISYCPLCSSGIIYHRQLGEQVLEFGNTSALYQSDMVMYDRQTFSYWFQVEGEAIVGELTGRRLELLPTRYMRWSAWRESYPDSKVLSRNTSFERPYERDPFTALPDYLNFGRFPFPVTQEVADNRTLPAGERVIGLVFKDEARAYPLEGWAGAVANDELGGKPVAIAVDENQTTHVFIRQVGEQTLTFEWAGEELVDSETGSHWTPAGRAISGPLEGKQVEAVPIRFSFWFAFVAAFPEATVFQAQS